MGTTFGNSIAPVDSTTGQVPSISSNTTLTSYNYNKAHLIVSPANYTVTLPLLSTGKTAYRITFINDSSSGTSIIAAQGADLIRLNGTNQTTFNLTPGDSVTFEHNGVSWSIVDTGALKVGAASPTLTGVPTAPTASQNTNTTQIATTAFVLGQAAGTTPAQAGIGQAGSGTTFARADHVHPNTASTVAQFDNTTSLATTAFVQRALGNFQLATQLGTSTSLTGANAGMMFQIAASSLTITLPSPATAMTNGWTFTLFSNVYDWTLASGSTNIYNGGSNVSSMLVKVGTSVTVASTDGANWFVTGTAALPYLGVFGSSIAQNGYQKLPSGVIIQWGSAVTSAGSVSITFPITFPTACRQVIPSIAYNAGASSTTIDTGGLSQTAVTLYTKLSTTGAANAANVNWIAIGN